MQLNVVLSLGPTFELAPLASKKAPRPSAPRRSSTLADVLAACDRIDLTMVRYLPSSLFPHKSGVIMYNEDSSFIKPPLFDGKNLSTWWA